jgi:hypothetical protein
MTQAKDEALKLALEALEESKTNNDTMEFHDRKNKAISAIKQALAAPVQDLPFGLGGGLVAIKTLLGRDPCVHANTAIGMIDAILKEHPSAQPAVPLTDEQAKKLLKDSDLLEMFENIGWYSAPLKGFNKNGLALIRTIEAAHGITKDQP